MHEEFPVAVLHVDILESENCAHHNRLFKVEGPHGMLERKAFQCIDMLLRLQAGYFDRNSAWENEPKWKEVKVLYAELVGDVCSTKRQTVSHDERIAWIRKHFNGLKQRL